MHHVALTGIQQAFLVGWGVMALAVLAGTIWLLAISDPGFFVVASTSVLVSIFEAWSFVHIFYYIGLINSTGGF